VRDLDHLLARQCEVTYARPWIHVNAEALE
jgi:hypothetical protein